MPILSASIRVAFGLIVCAAGMVQGATVKQERATLRTGCYSDSDSVATLDLGTKLTIRYSVAGESSPCYKVALEQGGKPVEGYLPAAAIEGLEEFDKARREAAVLDLTTVLGAFKNSALPSLKDGNKTLAPAQLGASATQLIESGQPAKALELLEPELRANKDPGLLMLAGIASWRNDEPRKALDYWHTSLARQTNPELEKLVRKVEKETSNDQSNDRLYGIRVLLRYDSSVIKAETARDMLGALDHEFSRVAAELGCRAEERVVAIAQGKEAYRKATEAAEWSGGQYDGRIRVPVFDGQVLDQAMRRTLAHEITHACLTMLGRWPSWLQEGLAQKLSGDTLAPEVRQKMAAMAQEHRLPRLANLGQDWSRMDAEHAMLAYGLSLAAIELFYQEYANYGIANLLRNPERLGAITADLDRRLGL
jgi:hypothetical protein